MTIKQLFDESTFYDLKEFDDSTDYRKYLRSEGFIKYQNKWLLGNTVGTHILTIEVDILTGYDMTNDMGMNYTLPVDYQIKLTIDVFSGTTLYACCKTFENGSLVENLKYLLEKVLSDDY